MATTSSNVLSKPATAPTHKVVIKELPITFDQVKLVGGGLLEAREGGVGIKCTCNKEIFLSTESYNKLQKKIKKGAGKGKAYVQCDEGRLASLEAGALFFTITNCNGWNPNRLYIKVNNQYCTDANSDTKNPVLLNAPRDGLPVLAVISVNKRAIESIPKAHRGSITIDNTLGVDNGDHTSNP